MNDIHAHEAQPRKEFTLDQEEAQQLQELAAQVVASPNGTDVLNAYWMELGKKYGFTWTTVADLEWLTIKGKRVAPGQMVDPIGAKFTAWEQVARVGQDGEAIAWVDGEFARKIAEAHGIPILDGQWVSHPARALALEAFDAGRNRGFVMGSATPQARDGVGWDGMELIRESAELLRCIEVEHSARGRDAERTEEASAYAHKAKHYAAQAAKLEAFLADPHQQHLVHDGLREARGDAAVGVAVGWTKAIQAVIALAKELMATTCPSAIPPLVLIDAVSRLDPPEDIDEAVNPWRGVMEKLDELRAMRTLPFHQTNAKNLDWALSCVTSHREWISKSMWIDEAISAGVFQKLGGKSPVGKHRADAVRELVGLLNAKMTELVADRMVGLRVQAAADVLQAMGFSDPSDPAAVRKTVEDAKDSDVLNFTRRPFGEGLECE